MERWRQKGRISRRHQRGQREEKERVGEGRGRSRKELDGKEVFIRMNSIARDGSTDKKEWT